MIACAVSKDRTRGKSELHRAGCWGNPSGGDAKESATERYRLAMLGKGGKVR